MGFDPSFRSKRWKDKLERVTDKERGPVNETEIECLIRRRKKDVRLERVDGGKYKRKKDRVIHSRL
jgi:hypothetical protein